jgi:hypothetical protein
LYSRRNRSQDLRFSSRDGSLRRKLRNSKNTLSLRENPKEKTMKKRIESRRL